MDRLGIKECGAIDYYIPSSLGSTQWNIRQGRCRTRMRHFRGSFSKLANWNVLRFALWTFVGAVLIWLPLYFPTYNVFQFNRVIIYAIAMLGLNILTGYSGQISIGHSFFFAG